MLIFHDERLAYLANPKTGTRAFQTTYQRYATAVFRNPPALKHMSANIFERRFRKHFDADDLPPLETVAVIRHPIGQLDSWYRYRQRAELNGLPNSTAEISFDQFIEAYLEKNPPPYAQVGLQASFVSDKAGDLIVHHLFQYEQLGKFTDFINQRIERSVDMPLKNQQKKSNTPLSSELESRLRQTLAYDFELHAALDYAPLSASSLPSEI